MFARRLRTRDEREEKLPYSFAAGSLNSTIWTGWERKLILFCCEAHLKNNTAIEQEKGVSVITLYSYLPPIHPRCRLTTSIYCQEDILT